MNKHRFCRFCPIVLSALIILTLFLHSQVWAANIDSTDKWAYATNAGWLNFSPTHGGGVTVYSDHLEGYVWAENVGFIRLGTYTSGGTHTYTNTDQTNYGVNRSGGTLSGFGWSSSAGWIKFNPANGGVTIDAGTGAFDGYAWGENIGWIHFKGTAPAYNVKTLAAEPTAQASGINFSQIFNDYMTINWSRGNGSNVIVLMKGSSAVDSDPVGGTTYTANAAFGSGTQIETGNYVVYAGAGTSVTVTGLTTNTTYYIAVYEYNGSGGTQNYLSSPATQKMTPAVPAGNALNFNGINANVSVPYNANLNPATNLTVEAWIKGDIRHNTQLL